MKGSSGSPIFSIVIPKAHLAMTSSEKDPNVLRKKEIKKFKNFVKKKFNLRFSVKFALVLRNYLQLCGHAINAYMDSF